MLGTFILAIFLGFPISFTMMAMEVIFGYDTYFDADRSAVRAVGQQGFEVAVDPRDLRPGVERLGGQLQDGCRREARVSGRGAGSGPVRARAAVPR